MKFTDSFLTVLVSVLPILLYSILVFKLIPKNYISVGRSRRYLITGLMSPLLIFLAHFMFPEWSSAFSNNIIIAFLVFAIFQVGVLEESMKYVTYHWVTSERISSKYDLPIATMFYTMMISVGFSICENIIYLINIKNHFDVYKFIPQSYVYDELMNAAFARSMSAVVMHMITGVIMGYYLTEKNRIGKLKSIIVAIMAASIYHGVYDLNLFMPSEVNKNKDMFIYVILGGGLIIGYFIIKNLIVKSNKLHHETN